MSFLSDFVSNTFNSVSDFIHDLSEAALDIIGVFVEFAENVLEAVFSIIGITDEDVTVTEAVTFRLIEDPQTFSLIRPILISILTEEDMMELIQHNELTCVRASVRRYVNYGESDYVHGLPTTSSAAIETHQDEVDAALLDVTGVACTSTNVYIGGPSITKWALWYLQENNSYNSATGEFIYTGVTVTFYSATEDVSEDILITYSYLETTQIVTFEDVVIETIEDPADVWTEYTTTTPGTTTTITNPFGVDEDTEYGTPVVTEQEGEESAPNDGEWHNILTDDSDETTEYDVMPLISPPLSEVYYTVDYYVDSNPSLSLLWLYLISSGTYPDLDQTSGGTDTTQALPIVPLRSGGVNVDSDTESQEYITSRKIMAKIGLDIDTYIEQITDNPDIDDIDDVFILFAMNIYTTTPAGIEYWFNFFDILKNFSAVSYDDYTFAVAEGRDDLPLNLHRISEQKYNSILKYDYIRPQTITGSIGAVGTYTKVITVLAKVDGQIKSYVTLRSQINATEYEELIVHGLLLSVIIFDDANKGRAKMIELTEDTSDQSNFVFPVTYLILDAYPSKEKEILIYESLVMTIYASQTTHLEYYETTFFAGFLQFIALVIFFYTGYKVYITAGGASALYAMGQQLLIQIVLHYAYRQLLIIAGDSAGGQAAATALYIYASLYYGAGKKFDFLSIDTLLLSVNAVTETMTHVLTGEINLLAEEMEAFDLAYKTQKEKLDEVESGLYNHDGIDRYNIASVLIGNFSETSDQFLERTAHPGNLADTVLQQPTEFVQNALRLPELDDTFA